MGTITSSVGLISGINTSQIITALVQADSIPVTLLQKRVTIDQTLNTVYQGLGTQLSALQTSAQTLQQTSTFQAATATSSDPTVLSATAANGAAYGSYSLQVARLVSTQQLISTGFSDPNQAPVGAGTITIDQGGGELASQTTLAELNGGAGAGRGQIRITDRSGSSAVIDTTSAVTLDDVVNKINTSTDISVRASIKNNHLVLSDTSGKNTSNLIVQDLGNGTSAQDLGIASNTSSSTVTGTDINYISTNTLLAQVNDGRGITLGTGNGDFKVNLSDGSAVTVNLATAKSIGDVVTAINTAAGTKLTASVRPNSSGIQLTDNTNGSGSLSVVDVNGSKAAEGLGLNATSSNGTLNGKGLISGLDTTLVSSLNGGSGLPLGQVTFKDRSGASRTINFASATNVQDLLDSINASGLGIKASLKDSGNGIQLSDTTGGTGNLTVTDAGGGTTAAALGIAGTLDNTKTSVQGANLHKQYVTNSTLLSTLNGGKGIGKGKFTISNSTGASATIDLTGTNVTTVKDLLYQVNSKGLPGISASINANGNGILINDTGTGANKLKVTDVNGTTASDLNIAGTATGTSIDGAYEKTLTVTANDTLATVQTEINNLHFGVKATLINDGSATAPYRLSLTSQNSGTAGRVTFDAGSTNLGTKTLVSAQDAAVFVGNSDTGQPLLITSSSNQVTNVISGVTLNLTGVSNGPVQLNVTQDTSGISKSLNDFVTTFNTLTTQISSASKFDTTTSTGGLLLGNAVAQQINSTIYNVLNTVVTTGGQYHVLADLGVTVGNGGALAFDQSKFDSAIAKDPQAVQTLFGSTSTTTNADGTTTTVHHGVGYAITDALNTLTDPISGSVNAAEKELTAETQGFQDRITHLNDLLTQKKDQLTQQFANMESVLASLQSQSQSLGSISTVKTSSGSSSSSSSSSGTSSTSGG